jgi:hypothetical protein
MGKRQGEKEGEGVKLQGPAQVKMLALISNAIIGGEID